jgi:hypothetical protein
VFSLHDQHVLDEARRHHTAHVAAHRSLRSRPKTPVAFAVLGWVSVFTVVVGAVLPGLAMAAAVGLGWLMWRYVSPRSDGSGVSDETTSATRAEGRRR